MSRGELSALGDCAGRRLVIPGLTVNYDPSGPTLNQSGRNQSDDDDDDDGGLDALRIDRADNSSVLPGLLSLLRVPRRTAARLLHSPRAAPTLRWIPYAAGRGRPPTGNADGGDQVRPSATSLSRRRSRARYLTTGTAPDRARAAFSLPYSPCLFAGESDAICARPPGDCGCHRLVA